MEMQLIKVKVEERIALVTLDNPPVNVLTMKVMQELEQTFDQLEKDDAVKVIIFTTAGTNAFIAGADIKEIAQIKSPQEARQLAEKGHKVLNKIETSLKPNIAAIHGVCVGGGNELVMAFHMRVASERAKFGQPEINLGIIPGFGGTQRLARLTGVAKARELILTGDMITAQEALRIGLVNRVVPDGELLKQTLGFAKKIASKSRVTISLCQRAIHEGFSLPLREGLALEAELFSKAAESQDMREGLQAFVEKRQPKFQDK